jgi:hypothetical protein
MAVGAELHADEEAALLEQGSDQRHLWGINIRPAQGNRSRGVDDPAMRDSILRVVEDLVQE